MKWLHSKNIYSLGFLSDNLKAANKRYLEFISVFNNKEVGRNRLEKVSESKMKITGTTKDSTFLMMTTCWFYCQLFEGSLISPGLEINTYKSNSDLMAVKLAD